VTSHRILLEVIVQTIDDARAALGGGADRLEVVRSIRDGGLTPDPALVRAIATETSMPLRVMVRENVGYDTSERELSILKQAAAEFAEIGVDGIVVGFARNGTVPLEEVTQVLDAAPATRATFHRAFDALPDPLRAIDELVRIAAIDRILTSGGNLTRLMRCERLREYAVRAGSRIHIVAGGGVDEEMLALVRRTGCVREVHVGRAARDGNDLEAPVSASRVKHLRTLIG
jgi:copper homeostasis protein